MDCAAARQCGSVRHQCERQFVAVHTVVYAQCAQQCVAMRLVVYGSARGCVWQCTRLCAAVCGRAAVCGCVAVCVRQCGSMRQYERHCVAVHTIVCAQCAPQYAAVRLVVFGCACAWQCAAVRQCVAVCGRALHSVWQCGSACVAVRQCAAV
jgi:hypothetical protein